MTLARFDQTILSMLLSSAGNTLNNFGILSAMTGTALLSIKSVSIQQLIITNVILLYYYISYKL